MPASAHTPRIQMPDGAQPKSRPLKTGRTFYLVVHQQKLIARTWDKAEYDPGDEAELKILGTHLGHDALELIIEKELDTGLDKPTDPAEVSADDSMWMECGRVKAETNGDQTEATAHFTFPDDSGEADEGALGQIELESDTIDAGQTLKATFSADGMEGAYIAWQVEMLHPGGEWRPVNVWDDHIQDGQATGTWDTPADEGADETAGDIVSAEFEDGEDSLEPGATAWLTAHVSEDMPEGAILQFSLEREVASGGWEPVDDASGTVHQGVARVGLTVPGEAGGDGGPILTARVDGEITDVIPFVIEGEGEGADGTQLEVEVEREVSPGVWQSTLVRTAEVQGGVARVRVPVVSGPASGEAPLVAQAEDADDAGTLAVNVQGAGSDGAILSATLEREGAGGVWEPVGTGSARVRQGAARVEIAPEDPASPSQAQGLLVSALGPSHAQVHAPGLDGQTLQLTLEHETPRGWTAASPVTAATVVDGQAQAKLQRLASDAPSQAQGLLVSALDPSRAQVFAPEYEGQSLELTLEHETPRGWTPASTTTARVIGGHAHAQVAPPRPARPAQTPAQPSARELQSDSAGFIEIEVGPGLEGQDVEIEVEPQDGGAPRSVRARVRNGRARLRLPKDTRSNP